MTTITNNQDKQFDLTHDERVRRCAEVGQVVPINKPHARQHYEAMDEQLPARSGE